MTRLTHRRNIRQNRYQAPAHDMSSSSWDDNFDKEFENFDRRFRIYSIIALVSSLLSAVFSVGVILFIGWAIIQVMQHYAII